MKSILFASFVGLLALGLFPQSGWAQAAAGSGLVTPPRKAPEVAFTLPGEGERLLSQYRGKVVALEFILTTCPHCQASSHVLSAMQQKYGAQGFQALDLAINGVDEGRNTEQANELVTAFSKTYGAQFPVGWVQRDSMTTFMGFSFIERTVVPQVVIIDRKGFIRYQTPATGESDLRNAEVMEARVGELLAQKETATRHAPSAKLVAKKAS